MEIHKLYDIDKELERVHALILSDDREVSDFGMELLKEMHRLMNTPYFVLDGVPRGKPSIYNLD